jgi:hypothetical protein
MGHEATGDLIAGVPVFTFNKLTYVRNKDIREVLGKEKANAFGIWMVGQTGMIVAGEMVYYTWDFERWLSGMHALFL